MNRGFAGDSAPGLTHSSSNDGPSTTPFPRTPEGDRFPGLTVPFEPEVPSRKRPPLSQSHQTYEVAYQPDYLDLGKMVYDGHINHPSLRKLSLPSSDGQEAKRYSTSDADSASPLDHWSGNTRDMTIKYGAREITAKGSSVETQGHFSRSGSPSKEPALDQGYLAPTHATRSASKTSRTQQAPENLPGEAAQFSVRRRRGLTEADLSFDELVPVAPLVHDGDGMVQDNPIPVPQLDAVTEPPPLRRPHYPNPSMRQQVGHGESTTRFREPLPRERKSVSNIFSLNFPGRKKEGSFKANKYEALGRGEQHLAAADEIVHFVNDSQLGTEGDEKVIKSGLLFRLVERVSWESVSVAMTSRGGIKIEPESRVGTGNTTVYSWSLMRSLDTVTQRTASELPQATHAVVPFELSFNGGGKIMLAARSESERAAWISSFW
jgi:hypothetical protein